ncbi:MAG: hypothetical protein JW982_04470 [Spirochaetes bacterium]|nr:hypothetical protein [Spirochaetota bacterium]
MLIEYDSEIQTAMGDHEFDDKTDLEIEMYLNNKIPDLYNAKIAVNYFKEKNDEIKSKISGQYGVIHPSPYKFPSKDFWKNIYEFREKVDSYCINSEAFIEKFKKMKNMIQGNCNDLKPITIAFYILIPSVVFTIIYSLHFLPLPIGAFPVMTYNPIEIFESLITLKFLMLFILTIFSVGLNGYFLVLCYKIKIKYDIMKLQITDNHLELKNYSENF